MEDGPHGKIECFEIVLWKPVQILLGPLAQAMILDIVEEELPIRVLKKQLLAVLEERRIYQRGLLSLEQLWDLEVPDVF